MVSDLYQIFLASMLYIGILLIPRETDFMATREIEEPLSISIRKSVPPLAAIQDEFLEFVDMKELEIPKTVSSKLNLKKPIVSNSDYKSKDFRSVEVQDTFVINQDENIISEQRAGATVGKILSQVPLRLQDRLLNMPKEQLIDMVKQDYTDANVGKQVQEVIAGLNLKLSPKSGNEYVKERGPGSPAPVEEKSRDSGAATTAAAAAAVSAVTTAILPVDDGQEPKQNLLIKGYLQMAHGLAYTGDSMSFLIYHQLQGAAVEVGRVNLQEGKFEIQIQNATGQLVAELVENNEVIGRGEVEVSKTEDVVIEISPTLSSVRGIIYNANSFVGKKSAIANAFIGFKSGQALTYSDQDGSYQLKKLSANSTSLLRVASKDCWSTILYVNGHMNADIPLYTNEFVHSLVSYIKSRYGRDMLKYSEYGIILGEVRQNGKPTAGARVEISGEEAIGPIYFNEIRWPDLDAKKTSANGLYMFLKVNPGARMIRAHKGETMYSPQPIQVEPHMVTWSELGISKSKTMELELEDVISQSTFKENIKANIWLMGAEPNEAINEAVDNTGHFKFITKDVAAHFYLEMSPVSTSNDDPYLMSRISVSSEAQRVKIPVVKKKWLEELAQKVGHNISQETAVVGFVKGRGYLVGVDDKHIALTSQNLFYFDEKGSLMSAADPYSMRGGFVIFGLPSETLTVVLSAEGQGSHTQTVLPELGMISVISTH